MSGRSEKSRAPIAELLHRLRSTMARVQAEAEVLGLDEVPVSKLLDSLTSAFGELEELEKRAGAAPVNDPPIPRIGSHVFIVDDDLRLAELTAQRLRTRGIDATHNSNLPMDTQLTDASVLVVDLGVLIRATSTDRAALSSRKFVILSGDATNEARYAAEAMGAAGFYLKPVPIGALIAAINRLQAGST